MISSEERLKAFQSENHITTKGPLSLVVQFTRMVRDKHRLTRAHREKQLKMSCQALHNAPPNRT